MSLIQPKPYMDKLKYRHTSYGVERRRNMSKLILEHGTPLPKPIEYSDIDEAMYNWVKDKIDITYDGRRLPTYKLYSTQRLSEYLQEWKEQDEVGNPIVNFKTVSRENNPQKGENQGNYFNIPGHPSFAMFYVPIQQENGTTAYDKYTMKQPFQVNFIYSVSIISNKIEIINKMNELMHYEFSAINCYISPNEHPMSMTLEDISDNSEYSIDDRKYYSQTYKVKVRGYIIRREDYEVERIPSRLILSMKDSDASGIVNKRGKNRRSEDKVTFMETPTDKRHKFNLTAFHNDDEHCTPLPTEVPSERPSEVIEPTDDADWCCEKEEDRFSHKKMKITVNFDCEREVSFTIDKDMTLEEVETKNIYDFRILVNDEVMNLDNEISFLNGDEITVRMTKDNIEEWGEVTLIGYDPNEVIDNEKAEETSLDEQIGEEEIIVNPKDEDK